jgi:para-nitrobenzyl esterase
MGWGAADTATVDSVLMMWTQFARTGNPSTPALAWPAYTLQSDAFVEFGPGAQPTVRTGLQTAFP